MSPDREVGGTRVRGLVHHGPGHPLTVEDLWLDPPGPGEVRVRMVGSGVCHSDLRVVDGEWQRPAGVVLGHEGAGIVEELGPGVAERARGRPLESGGLRVGDLVVLAWTAPCGSCAACARGEAWLCSEPNGAGHRLDPGSVRLRRGDGSAVGVYSGIGTFCSGQVVAVQAAIAVDPRTPPAVAALIGCAATTGVGAVRHTAGVRAGESVVILGLGGVGLAALMAAVDAGAGTVIAVDVEATKLELARALGATATAVPEALPELVSGRPSGGPDHVFECIGLAETAELALRVVRPGGTVTLVGMTAMGVTAGVDVYRFVEDGKRLLGSNYGSAVPVRDFPRLAADVVAGRLPLQRLISDTIALDGVTSALEAMRRRDGARRVVLFGD
jgi:S-(hydroxymethyl)glutathione dehydrogenase / alcohol dehydrogenase